MNSNTGVTGMRAFQRARAMKNPTNPSSNPVNSVSQEDSLKSDLSQSVSPNNDAAKDRSALNSFSKKHGGLPFSLNHSRQNDGEESNGDTKKPINNPFSTTARSRFQSAGLKARFAARMEKIVEDRMTIKQIFNRYVDNSTLHGFRFIFMKTFMVRRFLWLVLTCMMATVFFSELRNSILLYYQYPFTTLSTTEFVPNVKFPAISICNMNSFVEEKVESSKLERLYKQEEFPFTGESFDSGYDISGDELLSILKSSSQKFKDIFKSCEWKSRDTAKTGKPNLCDVSNFTRYSNMESQTCFTFNSGALVNVLTLNETGLNMAFKLELDLKANMSLSHLEEIGVKIVIHDQSETPLHHSGFVVSPGFQTFVEIKVKKTENLHPPYATKCGEKELKYFDGYRQSHCFMQQLSDLIIKKCGCRGEFMKDATNVPYCSLKRTLDCLMPIVHDFDRKTSSECPVDCNSVQYTTALSYARFLSNNAHDMNFSRDSTSGYINELKSQMDSDALRKYIEENIVVVQIFYQELKEENIKQEPSYDFYKLVGDVGGQLGLMLGASVLTLVEFVDLFFFTLYHQMLRLSRRKKKNKEKESENLNGEAKQ